MQESIEQSKPQIGKAIQIGIYENIYEKQLDKSEEEQTIRDAYSQEMRYMDNCLIDHIDYRILTIQTKTLEPRTKQTL